jgi:eukaryotic-like serine/threonine-protein kinase
MPRTTLRIYALAELVFLFKEEGATAKELAAADQFARRLAGWPVVTSWAGPLVLQELHRAGRQSDDAMNAAKEHLLASPRFRFLRWFVADAVLAESPTEARSAVSRAPAPDDRVWAALPLDGPEFLGIAGSAFALGGDPQRAVPLLKAATDWCGPSPHHQEIFQIFWLLLQLRHRLALSEALEQTGDRDGACAQYAAILTRWGNAKPRSVTADEARAHAKALSCRL